MATSKSIANNGQKYFSEYLPGMQETPPANVTFSVAKVYPSGSLPSPSGTGNPNTIIWVPNAKSGENLQYSNGSAWIPLTY